MQLRKRLINDVEYVYDQHHPILKMIQDQKLLEPKNHLKHNKFFYNHLNITLWSIIAINTINSVSNRLVADAAPINNLLFISIRNKTKSLPKAIPSAAAWTTRPNVAVHVAFGFVITTEPDESITNK